MTTHTFLDIAAVGIQGYLARTTDLKGRRGASAWLSDASSREKLPSLKGRRDASAWLSDASSREKLPSWITEVTAGAGCPDAQINHQAGQADGLVPLCLPPGADAGRVAEAVMAALRARLPAVRLSAHWATGASYVEVYREAFSTGAAPTVTSFPVPYDFPPLESCVKCRADPYVDTINLHEDKGVKVCADCVARYTDRYRRPALWGGKVPVGAETDLLIALSRTPDDVAGTFDALGALGAADGNRNHLATVYIDGNALGDLFDSISKSDDTGLKARVSREVSDATRAALVAATATIMEPADQGVTVPVIPHVAGGDDVLVSVVADRAWQFTTTYLAEFGARLSQVPGLADHLPGGRAVSASAGVVFARTKFPFRRCVELAEQALRAAKIAHNGRTAAVAWLDVTRDGEQPPPSRSAWTLTALTTLEPALNMLYTVEPSGRAVLDRLVDPDRPELSTARLREYARRLERVDVLEPFLDHGGEHGGPAVLADALSLVRWWR